MASEKKRKLAEHGYVDAQGQEVDMPEQAVGISYQDIESGEDFVYIFAGAVAGAPITLHALMGAKTLATNEASAFRQAEARGDEQEETSQVEAIKARFGLVESGVWRERGEGTKGPRYDNAILAGVLMAYLSEVGDKPSGDEAHYYGRLEEDKSYRAKVVARDRVKALYWQEMEKRGVARPQATGSLA